MSLFFSPGLYKSDALKVKGRVNAGSTRPDKVSGIYSLQLIAWDSRVLAKVITALGQAAESLRNAAALTEGFSALLQHASFVPTSHTHSQLLSSVQLFSQYNQLFGNNLQNGQSNTLPLLVANSLQQPPPTTGTPTDSRPPVPALPVSPTIEADDGAKGKRKRVVEKKEKKVKDPNAPRRPASAYILFQNDVRKEYVTRFPEKPYHEVLAEISKRWSAMTDQEKSVCATQVKHRFIIMSHLFPPPDRGTMRLLKLQSSDMSSTKRITTLRKPTALPPQILYVCNAIHFMFCHSPKLAAS